VLRALKTFLLVLSASSLAIAQNDYHISKDPNRQIYVNSAFAHGHRHGYEEGFHAGDEDYQLRRGVSLQQKLPKDKGYRKEFGDKASYLQGYETGFRAGYADSYSGRAFRLLAGSDSAVSQSNVEKMAVRDFDQGIAAGYHAGYTNSADIADEPGIAESAAWRCRQEQHAETYCIGYGSGYVLGRADSESVARLQKAGTSNLAKNAH
jgi:hypothetical protein